MIVTWIILAIARGAVREAHVGGGDTFWAMADLDDAIAELQVCA